MENCNCQRDADIAFLTTKVRDFDVDLNGNGKDGVKKDVITLQIERETDMKDLTKMSLSLEKLARKEGNREAVLKFVGKSIVIGTTILGTAAIVVSVIDKLGT